MPSQRKRIGFLPHSDVQTIIDLICKHNKLSQSMVTGILVEEALCNRGIYKSNINKKTNRIDYNKIKTSLNPNDFLNYEEPKCNDSSLDEGYIKDEIQMINEFIEFKFFKKIMNQNNRIKKP